MTGRGNAKSKKERLVSHDESYGRREEGNLRFWLVLEGFMKHARNHDR